MAEERVQRRLSAILAADIAGYSALMGADEARTVRDLKERQAVVLPLVGEFGGRIIDTAGDGILAEFSSVVNALECAVAIQRKMIECNTAIEPERRMQFRVGINLGDVISDGERIFGDGINVAARLEGIAEPGGICLSEDAYRQTRGKVDVPFDDAGVQALKNIAHQVRVYRVRLDRTAQEIGADVKFFAWPPASDPMRSPYRGLRPLEAEDAGIFFGRNAPTIEALDRLRSLREATPPRFLVILGASGSGKSSFMRASLLPRLAWDDHNFLTLPIIRPEHAVIFGDNGLLLALEGALQTAKIATTRADLRTAIDGGAARLCPILKSLSEKATKGAADGDIKPRPPTLVISIDQGEELFVGEGQDEARAFLALLRDLLCRDVPSLIALFTIRSDAYESLQLAGEFEGVRQQIINLPPMPKGSYAEVIKGPAMRLERTGRPLRIEDRLVETLLADIEHGGAKDALALLEFTLERLYLEYGGRGQLMLADYVELKGIKGSIEAAVERAFKEADKDPAIPKDRQARLALLRRGLIPWLAGIDPDSGSPRRRVARKSEIPEEARPLIVHLVEQRLLATDISRETDEQTIEPAHEALLRQWGPLEGWLAEDAGLLAAMEGVKRASRDWAANNRDAAWLTHGKDRLAAAERLTKRVDLAANLEPTDREYLAACRDAEMAAGEKERVGRRNRQRMMAALIILLAGVIVGLVGWINQSEIQNEWRWFIVTRPYMLAQIRPHVLTVAVERALKSTDSFRECARDCPEMIVLPAGSFLMGSPAGIGKDDEHPRHRVTVKRFAVAKFAITFADWDACSAYGDCDLAISDSGFGRGEQPVINVSWDDARIYAAWLSKMTGKTYRLLTESEYEYAARAGSQTTYPWGDDIGTGNANCNKCGSAWDNRRPAPVGSFPPNRFGLYEMVGNVLEWVEDCINDSYEGAPIDGSAWTEGGNCNNHFVRAGAWDREPDTLRPAWRGWRGANAARFNNRGFRVARTLMP
jgi:formylglycine-generating enzyme required for sulfatase activity/class 3 adenylate cyclase